MFNGFIALQPRVPALNVRGTLLILIYATPETRKKIHREDVRIIVVSIWRKERGRRRIEDVISIISDARKYQTTK